MMIFCFFSFIQFPCVRESRHWVVSSRMKWVTSEDSFDPKPCPAERAVSLDRFPHVLRAARVISARRRCVARHALVQSYQKQEYFAHRGLDIPAEVVARRQRSSFALGPLCSAPTSKTSLFDVKSPEILEMGSRFGVDFLKAALPCTDPGGQNDVGAALHLGKQTPRDLAETSLNPVADHRRANLSGYHKAKTLLRLLSGHVIDDRKPPTGRSPLGVS
jgi:hypothetical protein